MSNMLTTVPTIQFNRKDNLNQKFYRLLFRTFPENPPTFYVPSTEIFVDFILKGFCYGLIPYHQSQPLTASGELIDLAPDHKINIDLYFHYWNLRSPVIKNFSREFIARSKSVLKPVVLD
ncbi:MAG: hypothetical protein WBB19_18445 [Desulforhopalus sp.]